jgi:hypothetical protein
MANRPPRGWPSSQRVAYGAHRVGVTLVKEAVAEWKHQRREVFVPLTYRPGHAEVDFFEVLVDVDGTRRKAWLFLMRLMYSGRDFASRRPALCFCVQTTARSRANVERMRNV